MLTTCFSTDQTSHIFIQAPNFFWGSDKKASLSLLRALFGWDGLSPELEVLSEKGPFYRFVIFVKYQKTDFDFFTCL